MPIIEMPDGQVVEFPDTMSETQIRGLIASKYPREVGAIGASKPMAERDTTGHSNFAGPAPQPSRMTAGLSSAVEGMPIAGPYIQSGVENAAAFLGSKLTGEDQAGIRREMGGMVDQSQAEYPYTSAASGVAGGVLGTLPMIAAAPAAFGAGGGGLLGRTLASAASGAAIGGADSGVRSDFDPMSMLRGAGVGGALGAVGPAAGDLIGSGVRKFSSYFGGGSPAEQNLARAAGADGIDDIGARMAEIGPDAMAMDIGPNMQRQAAGIASTPGRGQEIVRSAVGARDAGANARISGAVDDILGPAPVPSAIEAGIDAGQGALGSAYDEVFANARAVDTTNLAHNLDAMAVRFRGPAQRAAREVRQMLNIVGTDELDPNPRTLHEVRKAIDGLMGTNTDDNAGRILTIARQQVDDMLSRAVPGIKDVDAQFSELGRQRTALGRGQQTLDSGRTAPRPQELAQEFQTGALPQGTQVGPSAVPVRLRQGARAEIERIIGTNANDRVSLQRLIKGEGSWNRDRLSTLFGEDRAAAIIRVLDGERTMADTSQVVTRGTETAARLAAQKEIAPGGSNSLIRNFDISKPGDFIARIGDKLASGSRETVQSATNAEQARLLISRDPEALTRTIRMVQAAQRRGDITAQRAKEIVQGLTRAPRIREPLEITVTPRR